MVVRQQLRSNNGDPRRPLRIHLTSVQYAEIKMRAKIANVSMSRYIVDTVLNSPGVEDRLRRADELLEELRRTNAELNKIGSNINQIARHVNTTHSQPADTDAVLKELMVFLRSASYAVHGVWERS